jgi:hypothetical protein
MVKYSLLEIMRKENPPMQASEGISMSTAMVVRECADPVITTINTAIYSKLIFKIRLLMYARPN